MCIIFALELILYLFYSINTTRNLLHWMCMICVQSRVPMGYVGARGIHLKCDANEKENDRNFPPVGIPTNCSIELLKMYYFGLTMYERQLCIQHCAAFYSIFIHLLLVLKSLLESLAKYCCWRWFRLMQWCFQLTITLSWLHVYWLITFNVL